MHRESATGATRQETLAPLQRGAFITLLVVTVTLTILNRLGLQILPLVAGASISGLAIGFGSQKLVQDVISGVLFLVDGAFRRGEYIDVGSAKRTVERIPVRSMQLRHHLGAPHIIPLGGIRHLSSYFRDWVMMKLELRLTYDTDLENGDELSHPRLAPVLAKAEELGILIFIHPEGFTQPERMAQHCLINLVGHPLESTLAISSLIFDGVLERYPGLKICVAHGGGFLPAYAGRMEHAYRVGADVGDGLATPPGEYLKRPYFDTMVFARDQLKFLIDKFGAERLLLGTDYLLDMGESDPLGLIDQVDELDPRASAAVAGGNAAMLLNL